MGYKSENKPSTSKKSESATPQKENIRNKQQIDSKISQKVILNESRPERNATPSKVSSDNSQKVLQQKNVGERKNLNAITRIDPFADSVITQVRVLFHFLFLQCWSWIVAWVEKLSVNHLLLAFLFYS